MDLEQTREKFAHAGHEAAVLACVLKNSSTFFDVEAALSDQDFLTPHHRAIWTTIKSLIQQEVAILDTSTILNQASALKLEERIGGPTVSAYDYINALFDKSVDPVNIDFYLTRLVDASTKVKVLQASDEIIELTESNRTLTGETLDADTIVAHAQDKFLQLSVENTRESDAVDVSEGIDTLLEEISMDPGKNLGLPSGFPLLDDRINGFEPGTLTVLGARPKTGKSTILLNWAKHMAYNHKQPVLYIDTEMSTREQQLRLLSILSSVPEKDIKRGDYLSDDQNVSRISQAQKIMQSGIIMHKYYPNFTAEGVSALTRKYHHQGKVMCLIFDYIKLPDSDLQLISNVKEHQALGYLCVALKNLAGQLQIPIITAVQLNREGANKGHASSANFADSDRILRYANTLLGLSPKTKQEQLDSEEKYGREVALKLGTHRLQVLDARAGGTTGLNGIDITFRKETLTMRESDEQLYRLQSTQEDQDEF